MMVLGRMDQSHSHLYGSRKNIWKEKSAQEKT